MKLAIAYSTKDEVENTERTIEPLCDTLVDFDMYWGDGSVTDEGQKFFADHRDCAFHSDRIVGGADASIAWKLSEMLKHPYTHIGLLENDVLLDPDWFGPTMELFEKGKRDGLDVGAVSARSYCDRVLIQRDGYAVMHNLGAGMVIFTREAAEIVLRSFRTGWWPDNVRIFAQLAGIDIRTYAAFRGQEQWITTDWTWDAQLAAHGLASFALTPAKCRMIGQKIPLEQQGLYLTTRDQTALCNDEAFERYRGNLHRIREGAWRSGWPYAIYRSGAGMLFFPHQLGYLAARWEGGLELAWMQGFGPFAYRAGPEGATLTVHVSGPVSFLCGGGADGASVTIEDMRSGFKANPTLPPVEQVTIPVPGGPISRKITCYLDMGAIFYGLSTADPQMIDTSFRFDWSQLPRAV